MARPQKPELDKNAEKLSKLRDLLTKNKHVYYNSLDSGKPLSFRMYSWIDDYNDLKHKPGWKEHCKKHGSHEDHDAYDLFA